MSVIWSWNNLFTDIPTLPICCVSPTLLIFIYSLDLSWNSEKKKNNWWYISSIFFLFLRSESKRLHITFGSHTMSYRTTQKWCQNEAKSTWENLNMQISRGTCLQTTLSPLLPLRFMPSALVLASSKLSESPYFPLKGVGKSLSIVSVKCLKKGFIKSFLHL